MCVLRVQHPGAASLQVTVLPFFQLSFYFTLSLLVKCLGVGVADGGCGGCGRGCNDSGGGSGSGGWGWGMLLLAQLIQINETTYSIHLVPFNPPESRSSSVPRAWHATETGRKVIGPVPTIAHLSSDVRRRQEQGCALYFPREPILKYTEWVCYYP